jgi:hypothetical protein
MQFKTKLGLVDIPNDEVLSAARDIQGIGGGMHTAKLTSLLDCAQETKEAIEKIQRRRKAPLKRWESRCLHLANKALI